MKINKHISSTVLITLLSFTLSSCGEFSYKRGAGPTTFQTDKESCTSQFENKEKINACLAENGWLVVSADKPLIKKEVVTHSLPGEKNNSTKASTPTEIDPFTKVTIGSWWKIGASPSQLMSDSDKCVAKLGERHQPQNNMSLVTQGFVSCMKGMGWYALIQ